MLRRPAFLPATAGATAALLAVAVAVAIGAAASVALPVAPAAAAASCSKVAAPKPRADGSRKAPRKRLDRTRTYDVVMETNCGSFTIRLDVKRAPHIAASFVALVKAGFFDRTVFHRIVPGYIIQGGDPTASGMGGPGYTVVDKPPSDLRYSPGVVAMAKTSSEPAGTSGSQFFVVTSDGVDLPPDYGLLGRVTSGLDVVRLIGSFGDPSDPAGAATRVVEIRRTTLLVH